jgi:pteridine reductase
MSAGGVDLKGRTALVTGGARRVGAAIARTLHAAGARIVLHYRESSGEASTLARELARDGDPAATVRADLARPDEIDAMFATLDAASILPDIVVNSASNFLVAPGDRVDLDVWHASMDVNLRAPYLVSLRAAERWERAALERADVVNITDVWGVRPVMERTAYCVSKAGLIMLTKSLARELAPRVRVNAVSPGPVLLPDGFSEEARRRAIRRTVMRREGSPEDVARAVLFLVGGTDYATGSVLTVDGGRSIV